MRAYLLMILFLVPLVWCIPLSVQGVDYVYNGEPTSNLLARKKKKGKKPKQPPIQLEQQLEPPCRVPEFDIDDLCGFVEKLDPAICNNECVEGCSCQGWHCMREHNNIAVCAPN